MRKGMETLTASMPLRCMSWSELCKWFRWWRFVKRPIVDEGIYTVWPNMESGYLTIPRKVEHRFQRITEVL